MVASLLTNYAACVRSHVGRFFGCVELESLWWQIIELSYYWCEIRLTGSAGTLTRLRVRWNLSDMGKISNKFCKAGRHFSPCGRGLCGEVQWRTSLLTSASRFVSRVKGLDSNESTNGTSSKSVHSLDAWSGWWQFVRPWKNILDDQTEPDLENDPNNGQYWSWYFRINIWSKIIDAVVDICSVYCAAVITVQQLMDP